MGDEALVDPPTEHLLAAFGQEVDHAALTERRYGLTGPGVQGDEFAVVGRDEDPAIRTIGPVRHTAMLESDVGGTPGLPCLGVVLPHDLSAGCIESRHLRDLGGHVDKPVDHQRNGFELARLDVSVLDRHLLRDRRPAPGELEIAEVRPVDLVQRRVARTGAVVAEVMPLSGARVGLGAEGDRGRQGNCERGCYHGKAFSHCALPPQRRASSHDRMFRATASAASFCTLWPTPGSVTRV